MRRPAREASLPPLYFATFHSGETCEARDNRWWLVRGARPDRSERQTAAASLKYVRQAAALHMSGADDRWSAIGNIARTLGGR